MFPMSMVTSISPPVMVMMLNTISCHSVVLARFPKVLISSNRQPPQEQNKHKHSLTDLYTSGVQIN